MGESIFERRVNQWMTRRLRRGEEGAGDRMKWAEECKILSSTADGLFEIVLGSGGFYSVLSASDRRRHGRQYMIVSACGHLRFKRNKANYARSCELGYKVNIFSTQYIQGIYKENRTGWIDLRRLSFDDGYFLLSKLSRTLR